MKFFSKAKESFLAESHNWFLWIPVLFGLGICLFFLLPEDYSIYWTLAIIESLILLAVIYRNNLKVLFIMLPFAIVLLGFANIQLKTVYLLKQRTVVKEEKSYIQGRVEDVDYSSRGLPRITLKAYNWDNKYLGNLRISLRSKKDKPKVGHCVELVAKVMPLSKTPIVGGFQFDRKSYFEGLDGTGFAESRALDLDCVVVHSSSSYIYNLRTKIISKINDVLPPSEAGVVAAILAGEKGRINSKITQDYRNSGLAHFLSISGLHMSMVAGLMFFFTRLVISLFPRLALRYDSKKISAIFAIMMSVIYLAISGAEIPSQRAFIMTFVVLLGVLFNRRAISMRTLSWAAMIILVISPQAVIGASFQMSFAAVIALVAFYEKYSINIHNFIFNTSNKWLNIILVYIAGILVSDLIASVATLPFGIYHFNQIAVYTTLANLMAGPIIGLLIMPFVLLALLLMPFGLDAWCLKIVGFGVEQVNNITAYVSSLPNAEQKVLSMPNWGISLIVIGGLWVCLWKQKWRLYGIIAVIIGACSLFFSSNADVIIDKDTKVIAMKSEQGDIVILPSRGNYFIKKMWLSKTANVKLSSKFNKKLKKIYAGELEDKLWLDLSCDDKKCIYKNNIIYDKTGKIFIDKKQFDSKNSFGANIYVDGKIKTVRHFIGKRYWNR